MTASHDQISRSTAAWPGDFYEFAVRFWPIAAATDHQQKGGVRLSSLPSHTVFFHCVARECLLQCQHISGDQVSHSVS